MTDNGVRAGHICDVMGAIGGYASVYRNLGYGSEFNITTSRNVALKCTNTYMCHIYNTMSHATYF